MSRQLLSHSPDLARLTEEGYDWSVQAGQLVVRNVPYVTSRKEVRQGAFISELTLSGNVTIKPSTHVIHFQGEYPCDKDGNPIEGFRNASERIDLGSGLFADHRFSAKPAGGYPDYYAKITNYIAIVTSQARAIDPKATARTYPVIEGAEDEGVFKYIDTASSRAGIYSVSEKLAVGKVAIVGLGGTGSYVLDLVSKTPAKEIHLFDGDDYLQHNAFRSPGAPSVDELKMKPKKVAYLGAIYSKMRRGIFEHPENLDEKNIALLKDMNFVFLCVDKGSVKKAIVSALVSYGIAFVDVGMGVYQTNGSLGGILRTTTSTSSHREGSSVISFADGHDDEYGTNIQIADLNALNAALAVIKWKKLLGFYLDLEHEHQSTYTIDGNHLLNGE